MADKKSASVAKGCGKNKYSIRVRYDTAVTEGINVVRNDLFSAGQPEIDTNYPETEIFVIETAYRDQVVDFLKKCGLDLHRKFIRFSGSWSEGKADERDALESRSLFLDMDVNFISGFNALRDRAIETARFFTWEADAIQLPVYFPRVRLCDIRDDNFEQLTAAIPGVPSLPLNGSIIQITAFLLDADFTMPVATLPPPYSIMSH